MITALSIEHEPPFTATENKPLPSNTQPTFERAADEAMIPGVGPEAPIIADQSGYKTSAVPYRMDLMPGMALLHLGAIMCEGAKSHGEDNWRLGSVADHLNKALVHVFAHQAGDQTDDHLGHAAWRMMAALEIKLQRDRVR